MCPHLAVHCGGNNNGCGGGEAGGGYCVAGEATSHGTEPLCRCRRNENRVGAIGGNDVTDATVWEKVKQIGINGVSGERAQRER
jgi:hypothetical protein